MGATASLVCLYSGTVSEIFISIRNTGRLLFYHGHSGWVWGETGSRLMDVSGRSTRDQGLLHLPQEQEGGATSARMFIARKSAPQLEVNFCSLLPRTDWLVLFQIILLQYESD